MPDTLDNPLVPATYLSFPLRGDATGLATSDRFVHVGEQIEQVLFTDPGERVFRPEFGAGLSALVFEPASSALAALASKRLHAALSDALAGEVDPKTLQVNVDTSAGDRVEISISYVLATISQLETHQFVVETGNG